MKFKKIAAILLALYAKSSNALDHDNWKCTHDQEEHPEIELLDVAEDFNPEGNDHSGRTLASYSNLRTYGYYGGLNSASSTFRNYVENELAPPILDYFAAALKVKYPVSGNMKVTTSTICGVNTPSVLKNGVSADYVHFFNVDSSSSYIASTATCSSASGSRRPLVGRTTISTYYMKATTDPIVHEKNMLCILHEVVHAMGFSKSLYNNFLDANGKTLTGHLLTGSLAGVSTTILNVAPLTNKLRTYFGCSTLKGAYMENTGSSGTAGCHFERRQFGFEVMTSGLISQMAVSEFTLALLEGTGWYVPDYTYADPFFFGQGEGCSFLTGSCSGTKFDEWCTGTARSCTNPGRGGGKCGADGRSDACTFVHPNDNYDCENANAESYARLPDIQTFGRNTGAKCFEGTLASSKAGSQSTFCFVPKCSGSGSSTQLTLSVGGKSVVCKAAGTVSVSGYAGTITCPDPQKFCSTVGQKVCPRGCMGRGTCVSGICKCNNGYKGEDCAFTA